MNIILLGMACTNYLLLAITVVLGLLSDARGAESGRDLFHYHMVLAISTALFTMMTHCLVFTYFLGTSRWVRETCAAYSLGDDKPQRSFGMRRRAFAVAVVSILMVVASIASGAWTDTAGSSSKMLSLWSHRILPAATYLFTLWAFRVEYFAVENHISLTDSVMQNVDERRAMQSAAT